MAEQKAPPDAGPATAAGNDPAAPAQEFQDEFVEMRKTKRVDVGVPCEYWRTAKPQKGTMLDISLGGARIQTREPDPQVQPEQTLRITFTLFKTSTPVEVSARVVRMIDETMFAVEWKSMSAHVRSALRMAINRIATAGIESPDALMSKSKRGT